MANTPNGNNLKSAAGKTPLPRIFVFSLGFLLDKPLRRMLRALGWVPRLGIPSMGDFVGIWGRKPVSKRGQVVARWCGVPVMGFEDGFLRSVHTGRQGAVGLSLVVDDLGIYFETGYDNRLHHLIEQSVSLSGPELQRAETGINMLRRNHLSKYNDFPTEASGLPKKFVLVIDQTRGDASIIGSGADDATFAQMLREACEEYPDLPVLVKTHPETVAGKRTGYFDVGDAGGQVSLLEIPTSPWQLFERAQAVYCVSSQLGMEAIFAGQRPVVYGNAFYCGWGLSEDRHLATQQRGTRSAAQLFAAAYLQYCSWYDPHFDRESNFETVARCLTVQAEATRGGATPLVCHGMRLWKRGFLKSYLAGKSGAPRFIEDETKVVAEAKRLGAKIAVWSGKETDSLRQACSDDDVPLLRVEDGFLRSAGLGAELVRPVSLAFDDLGIYYDPTRPSRLEALIADSEHLPDYELARAENLRLNILSAGLSKYNLGGGLPDISPQLGQKIILIPGQVEDDASILKGTEDVQRNLDLIKATRAQFPDDFLIYKPHPDVLKGLRVGVVEDISLVDIVLIDTDISSLLDVVDVVSTMTSLTGFEALLRGKQVVCFGAPFYAGWGLTQDHGNVPARRRAKPTLAALIHVTLIGYPRYWDPVTSLPCPVETVLERLEKGDLGRGSGRSIRLLAKAQGVLASYAHLWR